MKFVMYHSGVYYMRDKSFGKSFSLLSSMIKEYSGLNLHPYLPHINEICLGQFPGICHLVHFFFMIKMHIHQFKYRWNVVQSSLQ